MDDLAHRSDYLFEARCRAELDDRDPLGQADVFARIPHRDRART